MEMTSMDGRLIVAALLAVALALLHSVLGERRVLRKALAQDGLGASLRQILRLAWHLTSLYFAGCGAILAALAGQPLDLAALHVLETVGAVFVASAAIIFGASRGRHPGWPLFAGAAVLIGWTAAHRDGGVPVAVSLPAVGQLAAGVLFAAAALHLYWALSGPMRRAGFVPEREGRPLFRPGRWATALVAAALAGAGALVAAQALGRFDGGPSVAVTAACWVLAAVFLARAVGDFRYVGLAKRVHGSAFAYGDTAVYTPLCLLLALAIAATATIQH
jgi:hypothetical protein